jgi:serine/threonine-protein kinase
MSRQLAGRYRLDRRIGRGGMGAVYAGVDETLKRAIAVKMIRAELAEHPQITAKFHQEARAAAGLVHRNVVTIYDFGVERQHPFIIMELLAGKTLRMELDCAKRFSPTRTLEILEGVCAAVEEAHRRQLLHRDLKPENLFLAETPTGEVVKVLDFGLAKALAATALSTTTLTGNMIAGTPYYMAPEQLLGEPLSPCTDVWALGVIAYEMLAGAHPFVTETSSSWQNGILNGRFTPLNDYCPEATPDWQTFFERVFQADAKLRMGSAGTFRAKLQLAVRGPQQSGRTT